MVNNNNNKSIQPDWLKTTLTKVADVVKCIWKKMTPKVWTALEVMLSGIISSRSGKRSTVVEGPLVDGRLTRGARVCFAVDHKAGYKKESSQVFTFNRIGASCATLHSNQETLWHFNSQGNEWKSTPVKLFLLFFSVFFYFLFLIT